MSVEAMAVVLHHSRAKGTDKLVLLGIANHDGDGGAWPAVGTLARYANVAERSVQRSISTLVEMGEVNVIYRDGGTRSTRDDRRPNRYEILVCCPEDCDRSTAHRVRGDVRVTPSSEGQERGDADVTPSRSRGDVLGSSGVTPTSPEPSLTNHPPRDQSSTSSSPKVTRETADDGELSDDEQRAIALAVIDVRPEWFEPGIMAQLRQVSHLPAEVVRPAFIEAAQNRTVHTPMYLAASALDIAAKMQAQEVAAVRREHDAEDWRRTVHDDAENRATGEQRARGASAAREALRSKKREVAHARPEGG